MTRHRTFSFGGNSVREHLHPRDDFSSALQSPEGPETCNTYNMLKLSRALFLEEPDTEALDHYERATVNHILSSLHPKGGLVYFTPVRPGHYRVVSTPHNCFWCCVGTGLENHAKYGELVYTTEDDDLFVNLFIASRLTLPEQNLVLEQTQTAPYDDEVRLVVRGAPASPVALHIRVPSWHEGTPQVRINGAPPEEGPAQLTTRRGTGEQPLTYVRLERPWRAGDTVTMRLHPRISAELLPDGSPWVSFRFGPTVLAAEGDRDDLVGHFADDSRMGHVADGPLRPLEHLPVVLAPSTADPAAGLRRLAPDRLAFALDHVDARPGESVTLVPFAGIHDSRYTLYFPLAEPERLHERRAELHAADEAALALHDRTVDTVAAGEQQPESDHRFRGAGHMVGPHRRAKVAGRHRMVVLPPDRPGPHRHRPSRDPPRRRRLRTHPHTRQRTPARHPRALAGSPDARKSATYSPSTRTAPPPPSRSASNPSARPPPSDCAKSAWFLSRDQTGCIVHD